MRKHQVWPDQLALPGFEFDALPVRKPTRKAPFNLFFAINPEADSASSIAEHTASVIRDSCIGAVKLQKAERLHVSLHNLGGHQTFPQEIVDTARRIAQDIVFPAFEITFNRVARFGGDAVVLYGGENPELLMFQRMLGKALQSSGLSRPKSFTPHMTIAYQKPKIPERKIDPVKWTAKGFSLIWSHYGKERHDRIGEWRFAA